MPRVYILKCSDNSYYVGSTRSLETRLEQHASGRGALYTSRRLPVELVFAQEDEQVSEAYEREKQIQGWSRAKREALITQHFDELPDLARKHFRPAAQRTGFDTRPAPPDATQPAVWER